MRLWHVPQTILVAGYSHDPSTNSDVTLVRSAEDGALDLTFGAGTSHTSGRGTGADFALTRCDGAGSVLEVNIVIKPNSQTNRINASNHEECGWRSSPHPLPDDSPRSWCERNYRTLPNFLTYKLLEACREAGCPVCRLEQQGVERYLDNQFYENVNSPTWRNQLRASHAFCHEHVWLSVNKRLGDALGFSIIYQDVVNSLLKQLNEAENAAQVSGRGASSGPIRDLIEKALTALSPRKRCPACEHRDQLTRDILSALMEDLRTPELIKALQDSDGLCLPHLKLALGSVKQSPISQSLLAIHRAKLETLKHELAEFIRKNDYQVIKEGFGKEGDAWLRALGMVAGARRE